MTSQLSTRFTVAWVVLMAITLFGYMVAETEHLQLMSVILIMTLSGYKARLIFYRFMELGEAPVAFRVFFNLWLLICVVMISGLYWASAL